MASLSIQTVPFLPSNQPQKENFIHTHITGSPLPGWVFKFLFYIILNSLMVSISPNLHGLHEQNVFKIISLLMLMLATRVLWPCPTSPSSRASSWRSNPYLGCCWSPSRGRRARVADHEKMDLKPLPLLFTFPWPMRVVGLGYPP